jgi:glutamyl-tRNA reductase
MSVVVVGLETPGTPLDLLERVSIGEEDLSKVLGTLRDRTNLSEAVVLSTCLRTEIYAVVERFHEGVADLQDLMASFAGTTADVISEHVTVLFDDDVTAHLFEVAAGLRSAVLGETEVLGQVRRAAENAVSERAAGPVLSGLFRHAVSAGRRVRSSTAIARGSTSLSHVAVEAAEDSTGGSIARRSVVVVGAGEMARGVVKSLEGRGVEKLTIANRTASNARALAAANEAEAMGLSSLPLALAEADVVFVSTGSPEHVLDADALFEVRALRGSRGRGGPSAGSGEAGESGEPDRLVIVDMGMPRNVEPSAGSFPDVVLLDIEHLNARAQSALSGRHVELEAAREIVHEEVERYRANERARGAAPVVTALRQRLERLLRDELERHQGRLSDLDDRQREEVESVVRDVLAKVAHAPSVALKEAAGTARGERLVEALRTLFDI